MIPWLPLYRIALRVFPRDFRKRWGQGMSEAFRDGLSHAAPGSRAPFALREIRGVVGAGFRERFLLDRRQLAMLHLSDARYAVRLLTRSSGFSLLTILVLAGGLGLSTFTFSFLYTAMIKPLPLSDGAAIVRIMEAEGSNRRSIDALDLMVLRQSMQSVRELSPYVRTEVVMGDAGPSGSRDAAGRRAVDAAAVDAGVFAITRIPARFGRHLLPSDNLAGAEPVIVLSYRTWEVAFGSAPDVVDRMVDVNGVRTRVVGVMPEGYGFPVATEAWVPLSAADLAPTEPGTSLHVAGRLVEGATHATASTEATAVLQRVRSARDTTGTASDIRVTASVESFPQAQFGAERALVFTVLNLVATLILLLALVNVTNLLLARANERARETAVRMALGATTARLVMQGMWETIVLCVVGGLVGTAGAAWGLDAITRWTQRNLEGNLAFWWVWQLDGATILMAGVFVTLSVVVLGLVLTRRATHTNVREVLQDGSARSGARREGRVARVLVATQIATVTLLMFFGVLSGVMARRLARLDLGFDATPLMQVSVDPGSSRYADVAARQVAMQRIRDELAQHAGVDGAVLRSGLARPDVGGQVEWRSGATVTRSSSWVYAAAGELSVAGPELVEGRALSSADDATHAAVVVISRSLARQLAPGGSAVGQQLRLTTSADTTVWRTVVGVVSDIPYGDPWARDRSTVAAYIPLSQSPVDAAVGLIRLTSGEMAGRDAIFEAFRRVDPQLVPGQVMPYREVIEKVRLITIGTTKLFAAAFAFALLLAMVGSYGLMSRGISQRTREIGVRRALGASDRSMMRHLLATGARQLGIGALAALPLVLVVAAAFNHFFPVGTVPTALAAVLVPLTIVGSVVAATWVPARRALRVSPRDALWRE